MFPRVIKKQGRYVKNMESICQRMKISSSLSMYQQVSKEAAI
jgi:hypothetical protein